MGQRKGFKHSEVTKRKQSEKNKGKHSSPSTEFKKGHKHSKITIEKMKAKHNSPSTEFKKGQFAGEKNPNFKGWKSREPYGKAFSPELKEQIR